MLRGSIDTVAFRLWPPVAIGAPLLVGWLVTLLWHDPVELGGWRVPLGWALVLFFAGWNGWSLWLFRRHEAGLLPGQATRVMIEEGPPRRTVPARTVRRAVRRLRAAGAPLAVTRPTASQLGAPCGGPHPVRARAAVFTSVVWAATRSSSGRAHPSSGG